MAEQMTPEADVTPASGPGPTYIALVGTIRRDSDGLLSMMWGLADVTTREPVTTGEPGPWTWIDPTGGTWRHLGRGADVAAVRLWHFLDEAEKWARDNGAHGLHVGNQRYVFRRPAVAHG